MYVYLHDHVNTNYIVTPPHELLFKLRNHGIVQAYVLHGYYEFYKYDHLGWDAVVLVDYRKAESMQMEYNRRQLEGYSTALFRVWQ